MRPVRVRHGILHDEQGDRSFSRCSLAVVLPFTLVLIACDSTIAWVSVPLAAYSLLGTVISLLCVWAGGRAMMRYVGPQLGRIASGISSAGSPRPPWDVEP